MKVTQAFTGVPGAGTVAAFFHVMGDSVTVQNSVGVTPEWGIEAGTVVTHVGSDRSARAFLASVRTLLKENSEECALILSGGEAFLLHADGAREELAA